MSTRMQQRRGTASQWTNANPVLAAGEIGFETDTNKFKIGDGVNLWADLSYFENLASLGGSFDDYILLSVKGEPLGVAELDADGQVPASQLGNATVDLTGYATETYVNTAVSDLIGAAPGALDTLNELAAAIGDDASFFTTISTNITNAENAAKSYADGLATNYDAAGAATTAENNAKSYADGLAANYDAAGAASTAQTNANIYTDTAINGLTTDSIEEGSNKYFTDARARAATETSYDSFGAAGIAQSNAQNYADSLASNYDAAGSATSAVSAHNLETTNIHGIADTSALATKTYADSAVSTAVSGLTKSSVGLGNVDNTSDANKPVSTATQTALDLKADLAGPTFTGTTTVEDLEIGGALTFSGTATQIDSTVTTLSDPMIYLGDGNANNINDLGFVASFDDGTYQHSGLVRDASADTWKLFKGVTDEPTTTVNFGQGSLDALAVGSISATSATIGDVSNTELQYLNGVTSAVQTQLDSKANVDAPTITNPTFIVDAQLSFIFKYPSIQVTNTSTGTLNATVQNAYNGKNDLVVGDVITLSGAGFVGPTSGTLSDIPFEILSITDTESNGNPAKTYSLTTTNESDNQSVENFSNGWGFQNPGNITASGLFPTTISSAELGTINNASSNVQSQIANLATNKQDVVENVDSTKIGYLMNVSSDIQTQLDAKASTSYVDSEIAAIDLSAKQDVVSGVTSTEIGYLANVTSDIQTQLDAGLSANAPTITNPTLNGNVLLASGIGIGSSSSGITLNSSTGKYEFLLNINANINIPNNTIFSIDADAYMDAASAKFRVLYTSPYLFTGPSPTLVYVEIVSGSTYGVNAWIQQHNISSSGTYDTGSIYEITSITPGNISPRIEPTIIDPRLDVSDIYSITTLDGNSNNTSYTNGIGFYFFSDINPSIYPGDQVYLKGINRLNPQISFNIDNVIFTVSSISQIEGSQYLIILDGGSSFSPSGWNSTTLYWGSLDFVTINKLITKTILPENIANTNAPKIISPTFSVPVVSNSVSINPGDAEIAMGNWIINNKFNAGGFKIIHYTLPNGFEFSGNSDVTLVDSYWNGASVDGIVFKVVTTGYDNGYAAWYMELVPKNLAMSPLVDQWISRLSGAGACPTGMTISYISTVTPKELAALSGYSQGGSTIQDALTTIQNNVSTKASAPTIINNPSTNTTLFQYAIQKVFVNTSASAKTIILPASPNVGDEVQIFDINANAGTNNITIGNNSKKINGVLDTALLDVNAVAAVFVYTGTNYGWRMG